MRIGALNPPPALPIGRAPGDRIGISEVKYTYRGPARTLTVGWAIKPAGTLDWNDGQHVIVSPSLLIATVDTLVPDTQVAAVKTFAYAIPTATITIPTPGTFTSKGNPLASPARAGVSVTINWGAFDTWVWVTDKTLIQQLGLTVSLDALTLETYGGKTLILVSTPDASVGDIWRPAVSGLGVRYTSVA